jgi:diaminopropionate ammonia-lyase
MRVLLNQPVEPPDRHATERPADFHRRLPGYAVTRLVEAPGLASLLRVGSVVVKDETSRFGLPSFKILGASWATYVALRDVLGALPEGDLSLSALKRWASVVRPLTLVAASDGNHGRAVARVASWFGLEARIYVPEFVGVGRRRAIEDEGAALVIVAGNYDAAVDAARDAAVGDDCVLISDTARSAVDAIPQMVCSGYTTSFLEVEAQLSAAGAGGVDAIGIQAGVGGLAAAATIWARRLHGAASPRVVVAEPESAACILAAVAAGQAVCVAADTPTSMAVLRCGTVSLTALPHLISGVSCCVTVEDEWSHVAQSALRSCGLKTGPSGAAGLAGLLAVLQGSFASPVREHLGIGPRSRLLFVATESSAAARAESESESDALRQVSRRKNLRRQQHPAATTVRKPVGHAHDR